MCLWYESVIAYGQLTFISQVREVADRVMKECLNKVSFHLEKLQHWRVRENMDPIFEDGALEVYIIKGLCEPYTGTPVIVPVLRGKLLRYCLPFFFFSFYFSPFLLTVALWAPARALAHIGCAAAGLCGGAAPGWVLCCRQLLCSKLGPAAPKHLSHTACQPTENWLWKQLSEPSSHANTLTCSWPLLFLLLSKYTITHAMGFLFTLLFMSLLFFWVCFLQLLSRTM